MAIDSNHNILLFCIIQAKIISVKGSDIPIDKFFSTIFMINLSIDHQFILQIQ